MGEKCRYENYSGYVVDALEKGFVCDRDVVLDGYCEFHHPSYWKENGGELRRKFYEIVEDAIENNKPLIAIGYHLPGIDLWKKIFKIPVLFMDAKFYNKMVFDGAEFYEKASFHNAKFHGEAYFGGTEFHGEADFAGTEFYEYAFFDEAKFHNETLFIGTKFREEVSFYSAEFYNRTLFAGAEFCKGASFADASFLGETNFAGTEFREGTDFTRAEFRGEVSFHDAKFHNKTLFNRVKFSNEVMFVNSVFILSFNEYASDKLYKMMIKREDADKSEILDSVSFLGAIFPEAPHKAIFDHTYLGRVSFRGANIERIDFRNVVWPEVGGRYMVFDEALLRLKADDKLRKKLLSKLDENKRKFYESVINSPDVTIINVVGVYNMLRENYEYFLKYNEAGKFFISEMEVKRLIREVKTKSSKNGAEVRTGYKLNDWFRRNLFLIGLYKHLALYGETVLRQILISMLLVAFFWGLRIIMGTCSVEPCNYTEQFVDSVAAYMQVPRAATIIDTAERIISIPILSTVFIALRRKLERRYRH